MSSDRLTWVGVALVLFLSALIAAYLELGAISGRGNDEITRYDDILSGQMPRPLSFSGVQQNLLDCMQMADGIYGQLQFDTVKRQMAVECRRSAQDTLRTYPKYGFAALVLARMAVIDEDWSEFNRMLVLSQQGSPVEQWISVERLKLFVKYADKLDPQSFDARAADIDLLLESPVGIKSIASLYIKNESLRSLIAERAERLPEITQARFVQSLKAILKRTDRSG